MNHPLEPTLSPCAYPLPQQDLYGVNQPTFVYPLPENAKSEGPVLIDQVVSRQNPAQGYLYDPAGESPEGTVQKLFSKSPGNGGFVCGPKQRYPARGVRCLGDFPGRQARVCVENL